jgi:membrane protease YdiL (CAAX protease family)
MGGGSLGLAALGAAFLLRAVDLLVLRLDETPLRHLPSKLLGWLVLGALLKRSGRHAADLGLHARSWMRQAMLGVLVSAVVLAAAYGVPLAALGSTGLPVRWLPRVAELLTASGLTVMLVFHAANALLEEGLFRGLLLRLFLTRLSPFRANLCQAALFGFWHIVWPVKWALYGGGSGSFVTDAGGYLLATGAVGFFFGDLFLRTGSLWAPVVIHGVSGVWNDFVGALDPATLGRLPLLGGAVVVLLPLALAGCWALIGRGLPTVPAWGRPLIGAGHSAARPPLAPDAYQGRSLGGREASGEPSRPAARESRGPAPPDRA